MHKVYEIIKSIDSTNSRKEKEAILSKHRSNILLQEVLYFIYSPYIQTGLSAKKIKKKVSIRDFNIIDNLMDYLKENNTGSDLDIASVQHFIKQQPEELQELYTQMATKNLKIGITAKTINKIFGKDFIPEFNLMLANKYEDHEHKIDEFIITEKLDGIRAAIIVEDGEVSIFSRQGQPIEGLIEIENEAKILQDNMVYDGELLLVNDTKMNSADLYRATVREVRKDGAKNNVEFYAFDMIPLEDFRKGISEYQAVIRKIILENTIKSLDLNNIKSVDMVYVGRDKDIIYKWLDKMEELGKEGIMVNSVDGKYECKRSSGLLKVKTFKAADVRVVEIIEGTNKNEGKLGAITVQFEHNGELHECNCGSGFSDEERVLYYDNPELILGKIVEIGYFEISQNQEGGYGLRFPTFKYLRNDKDEISMY